MHLDNSVIFIILSIIILISHGFNELSKILSVPAVVLLIGFGVLLRSVCTYFNLVIPNLSNYVNFLGTMGLILIVLEGALDLKISRQNLPLIRKSFGAALVILLSTTLSIAMLFYMWLKADFISSFVNAIPFAVISSTVVIASIHHLPRGKKEFLTYEAVFSDILGIMLFNLAIGEGVSILRSLTNFVFQTSFEIAFSIFASLLLLLLLHRIKVKTKSFMILSLLVLMYSVGKMFHLSFLLLVFIFGLLIGNAQYTFKFLLFRAEDSHHFDGELNQFKVIVEESAFLLKTFFFITFGFSINLIKIWSIEVFLVGIPILMFLLLVRFIYLKNIVKTHVFPELFMAPKGLITIVLFYAIPQSMLIEAVDKGVILFVILATSLLMILGKAQKYQVEELSD